jgi:hypothetical protein
LSNKKIFLHSALFVAAQEPPHKGVERRKLAMSLGTCGGTRIHPTGVKIRKSGTCTRIGGSTGVSRGFRNTWH